MSGWGILGASTESEATIKIDKYHINIGYFTCVEFRRRSEVDGAYLMSNCIYTLTCA